MPKTLLKRVRVTLRPQFDRLLAQMSQLLMQRSRKLPFESQGFNLSPSIEGFVNHKRRRVNSPY